MEMGGQLLSSGLNTLPGQRAGIARGAMLRRLVPGAVGKVVVWCPLGERGASCVARARLGSGPCREAVILHFTSLPSTRPNGEPRLARPRARTCLGGAARKNVVVVAGMSRLYPCLSSAHTWSQRKKESAQRWTLQLARCRPLLPKQRIRCGHIHVLESDPEQCLVRLYMGATREVNSAPSIVTSYLP